MEKQLNNLYKIFDNLNIIVCYGKNRVSMYVHMTPTTEICSGNEQSVKFNNQQHRDNTECVREHTYHEPR